MELLKIYIAQTGSYEALTLEYYNFYTLVNGTLTDYIGTVGMLLAVILIGIMCYLHVSMNLTRLRTGHEVLNSATYYLVFLLFSAAGMLYFLPHMHERYGFLVDIVVVIYVMLKEKKFYIAIIWQFLSLMFYGPFLLGTELISEVTLSVIMLATMVFIGKEYYESYKNSLTL
ncbi:MAG: hypothetical protein HGA25_07490 [Clostridiales bacterium]|nr:hypothetical protein [Clostridiales bacterium]